MKLLLQIFKTMEKSEFCVLIKHCFLMGKNTVQAKQWLDKYYSISAPSEKMVKSWYADLKCGCTDINDAKCSGHPNSAVVLENNRKLYKLVLANHKLKLHEIAKELKIAEGSVFTILHEHLSMRKLCQSGCSVCSQLIKNINASTIQSVICNCFKATKTPFCINMWQYMKHRSTILIWGQIGSQLRGEQQVKAVQSDQKRKCLQARYFGMRKVFCILLRKEEPSTVNII